jgi:hypothetical protein
MSQQFNRPIQVLSGATQDNPKTIYPGIDLLQGCESGAF